MNSRLPRTAILALFAGLILNSATYAQDRGAKPKLSEEIERVLKEKGPEAAQRRFEELFPAKKDEYDVDVNAIAELGSRYMQKGDMKTGMLFIRRADECAAVQPTVQIDSPPTIVSDLPEQHHPPS
jgi:hypothetical protein